MLPVKVECDGAGSFLPQSVALSRTLFSVAAHEEQEPQASHGGQGLEPGEEDEEGKQGRPKIPRKKFAVYAAFEY